jgi:hypothetical protein
LKTELRSSLRLSEAILLGRLLVAKPRACDTKACAIGMALLANGVTPTGDQETDQQAAMRVYPWIAQGEECPWCGEWMPYEAMVHHPFDQHVMAGEIHLERLCDWLAQIEPDRAESESPSNEDEIVLQDQEATARKGLLGSR